MQPGSGRGKGSLSTLDSPLSTQQKENIMALQIVADLCTACADCEEDCPTASIRRKKGVYIINPDTCTECDGDYDKRRSAFSSVRSTTASFRWRRDAFLPLPQAGEGWGEGSLLPLEQEPDMTTITKGAALRITLAAKRGRRRRTCRRSPKLA
jgi:ferredoxin